MKCPICKKPVEKGSADFPFCSERCRIADLAAWSSEQYVVSTPLPHSENPQTDEE